MSLSLVFSVDAKESETNDSGFLGKTQFEIDLVGHELLGLFFFGPLQIILYKRGASL